MQTETFQITLPVDLAEQLHEHIRTGNFANPSDFFADSLRSQSDLGPLRGQELDRLIAEEVLPALLHLEADPETAVSLEEMRAGLATHHEHATVAR